MLRRHGIAVLDMSEVNQRKPACWQPNGVTTNCTIVPLCHFFPCAKWHGMGRVNAASGVTVAGDEGGIGFGNGGGGIGFVDGEGGLGIADAVGVTFSGMLVSFQVKSPGLAGQSPGR
jgi:hypothetical protein